MICRRLSEVRRDMRSSSIVSYWRSYFTYDHLFHLPSFEGWLTALCRPQERGRQCAVKELAFYIIQNFQFVQCPKNITRLDFLACHLRSEHHLAIIVQIFLQCFQNYFLLNFYKDALYF